MGCYREYAKAAGRSVKPIRKWILYECGFCGKPQPILRADVLDPLFEPYCSHEPPFGGGPIPLDGDTVESEYQSSRRQMLAELARLEAIEHSIGEDDFDPMDPSWWVDQCAVCNDKLAVVNRDVLLVGGARCRGCRLTRIGQMLRAEAIKNAAHRFEGIDVEIDGCACRSAEECPHGYVELVDGSDRQRIVLSWCHTRSPGEKEAWVRAYAERVKLRPPALVHLLEDVQHGNDLHLERPLSGPSLWPS